MKYLTCSLIASLLCLSACQNSDPQSTASEPEVKADISLRATSDMQAPAQIVTASFVPNNVATWLGHIILLDKAGTLHRATTNSSKTEIVTMGKYQDVIGLVRDNAAGVFLALDTKGHIKAFIEADEEGNFKPMAISYGDLKVKRFCQTPSPEPDKIYAKTLKGITLVLSPEFFEDTSVAITHKPSQETTPCDTPISDGLNLNVSADHEFIVQRKNDTDRTISIDTGLSIAAMVAPGFIQETTLNMGSVYNKGLILAGDKNSGRLVLISREYAAKELGR